MCSLYGEFFHCCCNDKGSVNLKFTYRKVRFLNDLYFVPEIRKNLVSRGLFNKFGFKFVFESNQFVLTK
jgi:hypothetical protein